MKEYCVVIPLTGYVEILVNAETEEEAIKEAFNEATLEDIVEWDLHKEICTGNVCHAIKNYMDVIDNGEIEE